MKNTVWVWEKHCGWGLFKRNNMLQQWRLTEICNSIKVIINLRGAVQRTGQPLFNMDRFDLITHIHTWKLPSIPPVWAVGHWAAPQEQLGFGVSLKGTSACVECSGVSVWGPPGSSMKTQRGTKRTSINIYLSVPFWQLHLHRVHSTSSCALVWRLNHVRGYSNQLMFNLFTKLYYC